MLLAHSSSHASLNPRAQACAWPFHCSWITKKGEKMSFITVAHMCVKANCPPLRYMLGVACSSRGGWEIGSSYFATSTYACQVAQSSRCTSPPLPGHLIMQISPEAHSRHSATQAGVLPNNLDPDLNANGPVTSECSVPTAYVYLEVITVVTGEGFFSRWLLDQVVHTLLDNI